jgi:adenylate cyclase class IV
MARNIEIKARVENIDLILPKAAALADQGPIEIIQDDTFFACESGRLKLRAFTAGEGELIFYRRENRKGPKESFYLVAPTKCPGILCETLTQAYGQAGRVRKKRLLYLKGRTRIHLDRVEGLGDFLELEVVLDEGEKTETGEAVARELMTALDIPPDQLIEGAYIDLLAADDHGRG